MGGELQAVILAGLAINFLTMIVGGLSFLFGLFRFAVKNDRRMTRLEADMRQMMISQGIRPRQDFSE